jgi:hypothetical protein
MKNKANGFIIIKKFVGRWMFYLCNNLPDKNTKKNLFAFFKIPLLQEQGFQTTNLNYSATIPILNSLLCDVLWN